VAAIAPELSFRAEDSVPGCARRPADLGILHAHALQVSENEILLGRRHEIERVVFGVTDQHGAVGNRIELLIVAVGPSRNAVAHCPTPAHSAYCTDRARLVC
jgi:hypothetical protein